MTTKRKAELQRRLSMASMPKPPAGLADRIKADIPDLLSTARERERLSSSIAFNLRVAASIILLISSAYLCVQLLSRADRNEAPLAVASKSAPARAAAPQPATEVTQFAPEVVRAPAAVPPPARFLRDRQDRGTEELKPQPVPLIAESVPVNAPPSPPPPPPASAPAPAPRAESMVAKANSAPEAVEGGVEGSVVGGVAGGVIGGVVSQARAADLALEAHKKEVFGISVDADAFNRVKDAIERGERPRNVNVEALINYFAGPPQGRAPREVGLEVEASPAPVIAGPRAFIIRATIDTAREGTPPNASVPPVATEARMEIELDGNAVVSHQRAGSAGSPFAVESTLLKNVSVTALYEVELRSNLSWHQPIATVRLHYRSVASGREKTITRVVHASDVARAWSDASRRHRLASLGAVWGETLKNAPGATDVARRAEELASQEPKDAKARELAALASASSRLQSSAPTGSGR